MTESSRDKTIEVMAEALCFVGRACDRNCPDVDHRPCPDALATWRGDAERALSHLQASGMAVVGWQPIHRAPSDEAASLMVVATERGSHFLADDTMDGRYARCIQSNIWREGVAFFLLPPASPYGKAVVKETDDE